MAEICIWNCPTCRGWHWDYRFGGGKPAPAGPFPDVEAAEDNARAMFRDRPPLVEFDRAPARYRDSETGIQHLEA